MGSFNNTGISGLWIGGKSVRRASLGGKVFFEKHDYDLSLTSDKSILSHADNESATLTATLTDYNEPVSGETVIFTADTPFKTNVINDTGTYDFGDYVTIDLSNFKNIDSLSTGNDGYLKIGSSSTYLNIWGRAFNSYIFCDYYRNGSEINSVQVSLNHPLIIRDGVLYCKKYIGGQQLIDYTLDVSDVDLNEWAFSGKVIGVDVTVDEYWWASDVTDSNGEATVGYVSKGTGDLNIKCEVVDRMLVSEIYAIEDCWYANDGSSVGSLEVGSNVSCTSNGEYITITTSTSGEKDVKIPVNLTGDWEFETTLAALGTTNDITFKVGTGQQWGAVNHDYNTVAINFGSGTNNYSRTIQANDILKITYINGIITAYYNNEQLKSQSVTVSGKMGYYTNNGRAQKIKNIILKPL